MPKALRNDITGLRAIAVLAVTFYHVAHMLYPQFDWIKGGFLGVDVFFVISGYLMTMIIVRGVDKGNFSLYDFYVKRAKRICPALLASVLVCLLIGVLCIGTSDLVRLALAGGYALLMASNMYFAFNMDYFANAALDQPLLHTWSLAVEWQFYMIYPLLILLLRRWCAPSLLPRSLLLLTVLTGFCAVYGQELYPKYAYYLLPTRGCELLVGSLAYFYPLSWFKERLYRDAMILRSTPNGMVVSSNAVGGAGAAGAASAAGAADSAQMQTDAKASAQDATSQGGQAQGAGAVTAVGAKSFVPPLNGLGLLWYQLRSFLLLICHRGKPWQAELLGLVLIAVSIVIVDSEQGWPTWHMVLPLLGAYLCVAANNEHTLLGSAFFQKLGLWSYAIYLVHWPVLVFITKLGIAWSLSLDQVEASLTGKSLQGWLCLVLVLLVMVFLGALLHYGLERRRNFGYPTLILYALGTLACFYVANTGASWRLSHDVSSYSQYGGHGVPFDGTVHEIGNLERPVDFIFVGDSFARHYTLDLIDRQLHVATVFTDGCYSFGQFVNRRAEGFVAEECRIRYGHMKEALAKYPNVPVLFAQDWPRYVGTLVPQSTALAENAPEQAGADQSESETAQSKTAAGTTTASTTNQAPNAQKALDGGDPLLAHQAAVAQDLAQLAQDTAQRRVFILGTPRQSVYDIGSTCMYLHAMDQPVSKFLRQNVTCVTSHKLRDVPFNAWLEQEVSRYPHFTYLDPNDALCVDGECEMMVDKVIPVYQDGLHYSWAGSIKVVSYFLFRMGVEQGQVRVEFEDAFSVDDPQSTAAAAEAAEPRASQH